MAGRVRQVALLVVGALVATTCASRSDDGPGGLGRPTVVHAYDAAGRLRAVADPDGETAVYSYDAAGNVVSIERRSSGSPQSESGGGSGGPAPVVSGISPTTVAPGDEVRIEGRNFTGDPLLDQVVVGGTTYATVESASATELVVIVPPTAPTGRVVVATPFGEDRSRETLVVAPLGYTAAEVAGRSRAELGEAVTVAAEEGAVELVAFAAERGQRVELGVGGEGVSCADVAIGLADPAGVQLVDPRAPWLDLVSGEDRWCGDETSDSTPITLPATGRYTLTVGSQGSRQADVQLTLREAPRTDQPDSGGSGDSGDSGDAGDLGDSGDAGGAEGPDVGGGDGQVTAAPGGVLDGVGWLPVELGSGTLVFQETDMVVPDDVLPVELTRAHWPVGDGPTFGAAGSDPAGFGLGSALEFDMSVDPSSALQYVELVLPSGVSVPFDRTTEGTDRESAVFVHSTTPTGFYGAEITWTGVGWDLRLPEGAALEFDADGLLRALRDRNGNATTVRRALEEDQFGQLVPGNVASVHSSTGRSLSFTYDAEDRVVEARNHLGDTVTYRYDEAGRLAGAVYASGRGDAAAAVEVGYAYDERGLLTSVTRDGAAQVSLGYDAAGRVASQGLADGSQYLFAYTTEVRPTEIEGVSVEAVVRAEVTDPLGFVRRVEFAADQWVSDTYAVGTPVQQVFTAERDPATGFVSARVDPDGVRSSYSYDDEGRLVSVAGAEGAASEALSTFDYGAGTFDLTSVDGPAGRTDMDYDEAGNLLRATDYSGVETRFRYDRRGRLTAVTDGLGNTTRVGYDVAHRVTVTDAEGNDLAEYYDAAGRLAARTDPSGNTTTYTYDGFDRVRTLTDPLGGTTALDYDGAGNLASLTDANGNRTAYGYDAMGRVTARTDAAGATEQFAYDALGNVVGFTDRRGATSAYTYDEMGRLSVAVFGGGEATVRYGYDGAGRLVHVEDSTYGTVTFAYDELGRLVGETTPQGEVTYSYDAAGRRTAMALADGPETTYRYGDDGLLASISQGDADVSLARDRLGRLAQVELPNEVVAELGYDDRDGLVSLGYEIAGDAAGDLRYDYDPAGRRRGVGGSLASATLPAEVSAATYGPGNRLEQLGGEELAYDGAGNLVSDGTSTYTWDARSRLVAVDGPVDATFGYDPFGRRTTKTVDGVTTTYTYDGQNVLRTEAEGSTTTYLTGLGLDELYARTVDGEVTTYLTDAQGSVVGLVDGDGQDVDTRYRYDARGRVRAHGSDDPNPFTYTGRELDETGLLYYRARYYSPDQGRFVSEDPIGFAGGDPNLYAYAANNPVSFTDPTGLQPATIAGLIICAAAGSYFFNVLSGWVDRWYSEIDFDGPAGEYEGVPVGSDEAQILIDDGLRDILAAGELAMTICSVALMLPSLGGLVSRGATSFGRGLSTRFPNATARFATRYPTTSARLALTPASRAGGQTAGLRSRSFTYGDLPQGVLGQTDEFGNITIQRGLTGEAFEQTLRHETVHSVLTPRPPLNRITTTLYDRSGLYRYLEEAAAEGYAVRSIPKGMSFPIEQGYVSIPRVGLELGALGAIGYGMFEVIE